MTLEKRTLTSPVEVRKADDKRTVAGCGAVQFGGRYWRRIPRSHRAWGLFWHTGGRYPRLG